MAKKKKVARTAPKSKKGSFYRAETYGIKFDSMTFLLFAVFALIVLMILVSRMIGLNLF